MINEIVEIIEEHTHIISSLLNSLNLFLIVLPHIKFLFLLSRNGGGILCTTLFQKVFSSFKSKFISSNTSSRLMMIALVSCSPISPFHGISNIPYRTTKSKPVTLR